jgi:hypothetical protein
VPKTRITFVALALLTITAIFFLSRQIFRPNLDVPSILVQVQQLNELATVKYTIQKVVGLKEDKQPLGSEAILLIIQASVQAGIDLGSLKQEDVILRSDGTVVLKLPSPKILGVSIDEKETKVWDRSMTWWTPWVPYSLDLEQRARIAGMEAIKKGALEMGILVQAERNAETSIKGLLGLTGVKSVIIVPSKTS